MNPYASSAAPPRNCRWCGKPEHGSAACGTAQESSVAVDASPPEPSLDAEQFDTLLLEYWRVANNFYPEIKAAA